jgi:protein tyrosine phosphatase (PTP) superfamily phosphohydrolase (DUF442 family)
MKPRALVLPLLLLSPLLRAGPSAPPAAVPQLATPRADIPGLGNFARVSDVLFRGEQPTAEGFARLKKMGIKTIVNLRSFHSDRPLLRGLGLRYAHIYSKAWHPEDEDVAKFLQIVRNPQNHPVFVHCQHGADRTGMMVAAYRIFEQGWTAEQAAKELPNFGFHEIWSTIVTYLKRLDRARIEALIASRPPPPVELVP